MIQAKIINRINFPEINLQSTLGEIAEKIIIPDIAQGIHSKKAISGGSLPDNEPATIKRKGGNNRPLIETGKLLASLFYKTSGKSKVIISISGDRKEIGGYLQEGIKTKLGIKQYRFFGISIDAFDRAMAYAKNKVKELTSGKRK